MQNARFKVQETRFKVQETRDKVTSGMGEQEV
jgi:hypothetical protein